MYILLACTYPCATLLCIQSMCCDCSMTVCNTDCHGTITKHAIYINTSNVMAGLLLTIQLDLTLILKPSLTSLTLLQCVPVLNYFVQKLKKNNMMLFFSVIYKGFSSLKRSTHVNDRLLSESLQ